MWFVNLVLIFEYHIGYVGFLAEISEEPASMSKATVFS